MRVWEPYLLHSHRASCTGRLGSGHAEEIQQMAHNCLVPRPQHIPKGPSTVGSETDVATVTILL